MQCFAACWRLIERQTLRIGLQPQQNNLQEYSDKFRRGHGLLSSEDMQAWLLKNDLDIDSYQYLMMANVRLRFLVFENNLDILFNKPQLVKEVWRLLDALWIGKLYQEVKHLIVFQEALETIKNKTKVQVTNLEKCALAHDFMGTS